jgi:hypothetical protein
MITSATLQSDNIQALKNETFTPYEMITSSTLKNYIIQAFKNDNVYTIKNENIPYTGKLYSFSSVEDVIIFKFFMV